MRTTLETTLPSSVAAGAGLPALTTLTRIWMREA
jgi:hypothetical protein